jgi:hypothetical protein
LLPAHRKRAFPPTETLAMFMAQSLSADGSCPGPHRRLAGRLGRRIRLALATARPRCSARGRPYRSGPNRSFTTSISRSIQEVG